MYILQIKRQARRKLTTFSPRDRERIILCLDRLCENPDNSILDVKKLSNQAGYRVRFGSWRVIFERFDDFKIINIEKIALRGDVYK